MTNLVGFAEKRSNFRNETFENETISGTKRLKNGAEQHRAKNDRIKQKTSVFQTKTFQFCVIARSAATWQSLSDRRGIPWRSTGARSKKESLSQKNRDSLRRSASSLFIPRLCFVPRNHSSLRDDKSFRQRLPRRAHAPSSQ